MVSTGSVVGIVALWMPCAHDIVTILIELHVKSNRILRTTTEAVVFWMVPPGVYYLFH